MDPGVIASGDWTWLIVILMLVSLSAAAAYHPHHGFSGHIFLAALGINGALAIFFGQFEQIYIIIPVGLFTLLFYSEWQGSDHHE